MRSSIISGHLLKKEEETMDIFAGIGHRTAALEDSRFLPLIEYTVTELFSKPANHLQNTEPLTQMACLVRLETGNPAPKDAEMR